ncbi:hypothetical protein DM02DRAFT_664167 [Periconia macrospinosa]|uniref:BHLH domain-containing protein n=1 Tax=Periconia macrospinosa TaxID=97972 RepID=A0A2V1D1X8_9PLEO|nr:hypothetical protein DM02DRAFT_664167 [Periconia macrospinosa]
MAYPMVANADYSPLNEAFSYPEAIFNPAQTVVPAATTTANVDPRASVSSAPFGRLEPYSSSFPFDPPVNADSFGCGMSPRDPSPTPSLDGDGEQHVSFSPHPLKRESSSSSASEADGERPPKRPQRKRVRPRLDRSLTTKLKSSSTSKYRQRLPHNQVERKYREGLNAELERLRRAVPTLPQGHEGVAMGQAKPGKAMVLAGAIDYIKKIEQERDMLAAELDGMRNEAMNRGYRVEAIDHLGGIRPKSF